MPDAEDRLTHLLTQLAEPADPTGIFEQVQARMDRRHRRHRALMAGTAALVLIALTAGGVAFATRDGSQERLRTTSRPKPVPTTPSPPSTGRPTPTTATVTVLPSADLVDGQQVQVRVGGYGGRTKVWLSECASVEAANPGGCGEQLAAQPFVITDDRGSALATFVVRATASSALSAPVARSCTSQCVLVATSDADGRFASASLHFSTPSRPTPSQITATMTKTVEVGSPSEHFAPSGETTTVSDGNGGFLSAVVGIRSPTADAKGQLVFFWHNQTFIGWSSNQEAMAITAVVASGPNAFAVTYDNYAPNDALCCPSLAAVTITYRWDGRAITPSALPPPGVSDLYSPAAHPVYVRLSA